MSRGWNISFLIFLRWTIEIKLQSIFLRAIHVIEADGDRLVRKGLNRVGNGTRGLGGVDDRCGETNNGGYADHDREHGGAAQQAESASRKERGRDAQREDSGNRGSNQGASPPHQVAIARDRGGGESGKDQQPAENSVSRRKPRRELLVVTGTSLAAADSQIFGDQQRSRGHGGQYVARQLRLRCAE